MEIFGVPHQALLGQLLLGLVNGSFYAMLSLGLAVIFGLLGIVNFAHGALYMIGAYVAWLSLEKFGLNYWWALVIAPLVVGLLGIVIERALLRHLYRLDPLYGLLLTFGLALVFAVIAAAMSCLYSSLIRFKHRPRQRMAAPGNPTPMYRSWRLDTASAQDVSIDQPVRPPSPQLSPNCCGSIRQQPTRNNRFGKHWGNNVPSFDTRTTCRWRDRLQ